MGLTMTVKEEKRTLNKPYMDVIDKIIEKIKAEDFEQKVEEVDKFFNDPLEAAETSLANRYKLAYIIMLNRLPKWKRKIVEESTDDRITNELAREVSILAESEDWMKQLDNLE